MKDETRAAIIALLLVCLAIVAGCDRTPLLPEIEPPALAPRDPEPVLHPAPATLPVSEPVDTTPWVPL